MNDLLAIDVGNTTITLGVYRGDELVAHWSIATRRERTADEYAVLLESLFAQQGVKLSQIEHSVLGCVVPPLLSTFQEIGERYLSERPLVVGPGIELGLRICTDNPKELGADRVANALAAKRLYGTPAIVIDFSTATTFDAVSREGDYLGDAIAPGLGIAADALFRQTAKLPRVELTAPPSPIGRNTEESIQSGLVYGYVGLVEGMVERLRQELGEDARVIATGEHAALIARHTDVIQVVDPHLTLAGLRFIYELNRGS